MQAELEGCCWGGRELPTEPALAVEQDGASMVLGHLPRSLQACVCQLACPPISCPEAVFLLQSPSKILVN